MSNEHAQTIISHSTSLFNAPSLTRPFGIYLWPLFEQACLTLKGYKPQDFRFVSGSTPMSTLSMTLLTLTTYYVVIFGGREYMRGRESKQLHALFKIHNLGLTIISGVLLALFLEQLIPTVVEHGILFAVCKHKGGWTDELVVLYYVS